MCVIKNKFLSLKNNNQNLIISIAGSGNARRTYSTLVALELWHPVVGIQCWYSCASIKLSFPYIKKGYSFLCRLQFIFTMSSCWPFWQNVRLLEPLQVRGFEMLLLHCKIAHKIIVSITVNITFLYKQFPLIKQSSSQFPNNLLLS